MRPLSALGWKVALLQGPVLALGYLAATQAGELQPYQTRAIVVGLVGIWLAESLVVVGAGRLLARPLEAVLAAPPPIPPILRARAAAVAASLPRACAGALLSVGILGCFVSEGVTLASHGLHVDFALAALAIILAVSLLGAMLASALCSRTLAGIAERIDLPEEQHGVRTLRGQVLSLGLGLSVIGILLVGSVGYLRYRQVIVSDASEAAGRMAELQVALMPGETAEDVAAALTRGSGLPAAVLSPSGEVLSTAGAIPRGMEPVPLAPGLARTPVGWTVTREAPLLGYVRLYLPEAMVTRRMGAFAWSVLLATLITLGASAALAWLAATAITMPLRALGNAADRIAAGDLTASPRSVSADDVGRVAVQFRRMVQGLAGLVREVQAATGQLSTGVIQAGSIGEQVRRGALEQHEGVQAVQSAVEAMENSMAMVSRGLVSLSEYVSATTQAVGEMAEAFDGVQKKALELERTMGSALGDVDRLGSAGREADERLVALEAVASRSGGTLAEVKASVSGLELAATESETTAAAIADLAERAGAVVEGTVSGIDALRSAVTDAHRRIAALGRRSDDIDQVLAFISEVAGRTSLLSLNASIIAAQAGEQGKAFAVVADHIRELAAQIARSTKSIGDIIHAVRDDVESTAALIDRSDTLAEEGVVLARASLEALAGIRGATARGRETAAGIRTAVQAHAQSSGEVAGLVELVAEGSRAVAAAVQLVGRSVGGVHSASRGVSGMADGVARTLEEQSGMSKRQLENLTRLEAMIQEVTGAVEDHTAAVQAVKRALHALSHAAGQHESAVHGLAGVSDQIGSSARALSERVNRFKV